MRRVFLLISFIITGEVCLGQDYRVEIDKAGEAFEKKKYDSCAFYFEKAFKINLPSGSDLYNAAVCNTLNGENERALALLSKAIRSGINISKLKIDPNLEMLHSLGKWKKLMRQAVKIQADSFRTCQYPREAEELAKLWEADQYYRFRLGHAYDNNDTITANKIWPLMRRSDSVNLLRFEAVMQKTGWPTSSKVGRRGASTAFLIIDHSPREVMEKYFPFLEEAAKSGQASMKDYATMKDRILVNRGKKQIYATQKYWDEKQGKFVYFPIEDEKKVNALRKDVGLELLSEFE